MNTSAIVAAELGLTLVVPEHGAVPLTASLNYRRDDPYAIRMAFHVGTDEPVEWNISLSSPFGQAHFEAQVTALTGFLLRTYEVVPAGREADYIDIETELSDLLRCP